MRDFRKKWALAPAWLRIWCIVAVPLAPQRGKSPFARIAEIAEVLES